MGTIGIAAAAVVIAFLAGGWTGWDYRDGHYAKQEAQRQTMAAELREANRDFAIDVATATEQAISKIRVTNRTINNEIHTDRSANPVLNDPNCTYPDSTVRLLNAARGVSGGGPGPAKPDAAVPGTAAGKAKAADGRPR